MMKTKMKALNQIPRSSREFPFLFECREISLQNWPPRLSRILIHFIQIKE
jgi:hypothetical protein